MPLMLLVQLLLPRLDLHQPASILVVVLLQLLQLATLLEKGLTSRTALVLQDLLLFKVSTLCTLLELVTVVLVTHFQVIKSVCECLDFLLALPNFAIELVTISLQLFLLLSRLDHVVSLRVLAD